MGVVNKDLNQVNSVEVAKQKIDEMRDAVCDLNYTILLNEKSDDKFSVGYYCDEEMYFVYHNVWSPSIVLKTSSELEVYQGLVRILSVLYERRVTAVDLETKELEKLPIDLNSHFYYKGYDISFKECTESQKYRLEVVGKLFEDSSVCEELDKNDGEENVRNYLKKVMQMIDDTQIIDELNAIIRIVRGERKHNPVMITLLEKYLLARKQFILDGDIHENVAKAAKDLLIGKKTE